MARSVSDLIPPGCYLDFGVRKLSAWEEISVGTMADGREASLAIGAAPARTALVGYFGGDRVEMSAARDEHAEARELAARWAQQQVV